MDYCSFNEIYMYCAVKRNTSKILQYSKLLSAIKCSGKSHAVNDCSVEESAAIPLHFHCTFTVSLSSVGLSTDFQSRDHIYLQFLAPYNHNIVSSLSHEND